MTKTGGGLYDKDFKSTNSAKQNLNSTTSLNQKSNSTTSALTSKTSQNLASSRLTNKRFSLKKFILLLFKLYEIKRSHKRTQRLYKDYIFLYPHLKYEKLELCADYKEALKLKFHLSFLLGQAIIKADKAWFKGGYLKLNDYIKEAKETFREFKAYENEVDSFALALIFENKAQILLKDKNLKEALIDLLNSLNLNQKEAFVRNLLKFVEGLDFTLNLNSSLSQNSNKNLNSNSNKTLNSSSNQTLNSKQNPIQQAFQNESFRKDLGLFLKDFLNLLQDFKDYEALNEALKHNLSFNFAFLYENLSSIKTWLSSSEFKEKFHNHPYPSLLNPEKIEYESINAELAWEMNLPLPPFYEFVYVLIHGAGGTTMTHFLRLCEVNLNRHWGEGDFQYKQVYKMLLNSKSIFNGVIVSGSNYNGTKEKMAALCAKFLPVLCVVRDPISICKHIFNHGTKGTISKKPLREFTLQTPMQNLFDFEVITRLNFVSLEEQIKNHSSGKIKEMLFYINEFLDRASKILYVPMEDILPAKAYETLCFLSKELGFKKPNELAEFKRKINTASNYSNHAFFPRALTFNLNDTQIRLEILMEQNDKEAEFTECVRLFSQSSFLIDELRTRVYCKKEEFVLLEKEKDLFDKAKAYLSEYFAKMEDFYNKEKQKLVDENDILECFKKDKISALSFKKMLDFEYAHLKKTRPDIVASWKYYAEFEKICAGFDG